jgi:outer membrane receptor protein involved in Fe transport
MREFAGFGNLDYHFNRQLDAQLGFRESYIRVTDPDNYAVGIPEFAGTPTTTSTTSTTPTYLVTLRYRPRDTLMVYTRFSTGFRPGDGDDNAPATAICHVQNYPCAIKPDQTYSYEVGAKGTVAMLSYDLSAYHIDWKDIQISLRSAAGIPFTGNGSGAKSDGVELSGILSLGGGITLSGWVSYDHAIMTKPFAVGEVGDPLPNTPSWSGNIAIDETWRMPHDLRASVGANADFVGKRLGLFTGGERQLFGGYTQFDLHGTVRAGSWSAELALTNLFNSEALLSGGIGSSDPDGRVYLVPRTVSFLVSKSF